MLHSVASSATSKPIIAQAASGQSVNLQEWQNSSGSALSVVDKSGNLGIGTSAPVQQLEVKAASPRIQITSTATSNNAGFFFRVIDADSSTRDGGLYFQATNASYANPFFSISGDNTHYHLNVLNTGLVGIGTTAPGYTLDVAGQVHATGFPTSSDLRFKEDIAPIDNALEKVLRLSGVYFKWNQLHRETLKRSQNLTGRQVGLIAQQVKEVVPEVVSEWKDKGAGDYLAVDYSRLNALTIEAIKELAEQNAALREENKAIREEIKSLQHSVKQSAAS
jgi:hypothetical protein